MAEPSISARTRAASRRNPKTETKGPSLSETPEDLSFLAAMERFFNRPPLVDRSKDSIVAEEPEMAEPEMAEPEMAEPEMAEPEMAEPEMAEPEMAEPERAEPERAEPEMAESPAAPKPRRKSPPRAEYEPAPEEEPEAAPPKDVPVAPEDDETLSTLFKTATGTPFDPKSSRDADYMKKIRETLAEQGGLKGMTPTQFALKLYRKYD